MEVSLSKDISGFSNFYPMKIYEKGEVNNALPCDITSFEVTQDYEIPNKAIENNEYISDNIYRQPFNLRISVYVENSNIQEFERRLKSIQYSNNGFIIIDQNNQKYSNIYLMGYTKITEINDGFYYEIILSEVIKINALGGSYIRNNSNNPSVSNNVSNAGASKRVNNGEQTANKRQSVLKTIGGLI